MESAWLIRLKNGYRVILSEKNYEKYKKVEHKGSVKTEEHWFDMKECIEENPSIDKYIEPELYNKLNIS